MERSAVHTFLQKCSPTLRIFGVFHPFCVNKKLKTHLRELSRQSPVPKIRSCFLSEFSGIGRTCFFFFLWFAFFLLFQKKEERNERKNKVVLFYTIYPSYRILNFQTVPQIKIWNRISTKLRLATFEMYARNTQSPFACRRSPATKHPSYANQLFACRRSPAQNGFSVA